MSTDTSPIILAFSGGLDTSFCVPWLKETYGRDVITATVDTGGIDAADAVTPAPWGDISPAECRKEAGSRLVLSGGVPPDSFHPSVPIEVFDQQIEAWLNLRHASNALVIAPGDQLPPKADIQRVRRMVDIASG